LEEGSMQEGISRSRENRIFGGIASGIGKYFTIDPIIVRVLFVLSVLFSGIGVLVYLIMWIAIPEEKYNFGNTTDEFSNTNEYTNPNINFTFPEKKEGNGKIVFGVILIILGMFFLGIKIFSFLNFEDLFPIILISIGVLLLWKSKK
jgi:phage shock protein C